MLTIIKEFSFENFMNSQPRGVVAQFLKFIENTTFQSNKFCLKGDEEFRLAATMQSFHSRFAKNYEVRVTTKEYTSRP